MFMEWSNEFQFFILKKKNLFVALFYNLGPKQYIHKSESFQRMSNLFDSR